MPRIHIPFQKLSKGGHPYLQTLVNICHSHALPQFQHRITVRQNTNTISDMIKRIKLEYCCTETGISMNNSILNLICC